MKKIFAVICVFALLAVAAGCSSYSSDNYSGGTAASSMAAAYESAPQASPPMREDGGLGFTGEKYEAEYDMADEATDMEEAQEAPSASAEAQQVPDSRKIVKTVQLTLQTTTFDEGVIEIDRIAKSFGGYVQDSYVEGRDLYNERGARSANFTVRIPAASLDAFTSSLGDPQFNLVNKNQSEEDISFNYYDSQARLKSLLVQEERLIAMLEKAEELKYMLQVEQELANVRYQIESMQSQLGRMDNSVNLSTVYIQLMEVVKYEPVVNVPITFSQRVGQAFEDSWEDFADNTQDFAIVMIYLLPALLVLAAIVGIILAIVFSASRAGKRKRAAAAAARAALAEARAEAPPEAPKQEK